METTIDFLEEELFSISNQDISVNNDFKTLKTNYDELLNKKLNVDSALKNLELEKTKLIEKIEDILHEKDENGKKMNDLKNLNNFLEEEISRLHLSLENQENNIEVSFFLLLHFFRTMNF